MLEPWQEHDRGLLSLQDVALHSCLYRKHISDVSTLLTPILVFVLGLYTPLSPNLGICYCSYAECLLLEMNNCCHHGLSTECVSTHSISSSAAAHRKNRDLHNNGEQLGWSLSYLLLSNVPQTKGPEIKSCHFFFPLEAVSCTGLAIYHTRSRTEWWKIISKDFKISLGNTSLGFLYSSRNNSFSCKNYME